MTEINNYFEALERSLKKISIILIDDFEEIKKGFPGPTISLIRKLLFHTSTIVMKNMLLRSVASHVTDKKLVIATFDLLRETIKHSPGITIDQFFSNGFATHKLTMLHKIAEYVASVDRNIVRTPQKTTIVVPNESILKLSSPNGSLAQPSVEDLSTHLMASAVNGENLSSSGSWPITDFLKHHMMVEKNKSKNSLTTTTSSIKKGDSTPSKRSNSAPRYRTTTPQLKTTKEIPSSALHPDKHVTMSEYMNSELDEKNHRAPEPPLKKELFKENPSNHSNLPPSPPLANDGLSPKPSFRRSMSVEDFLNTNPDGTINYDSIVKNELFQEKVNKFIDQRVAEILRERTDTIVKEVSEKYDFVINKLVAAVDAEFTLLNNRIKILEAQTKN